MFIVVECNSTKCRYYTNLTSCCWCFNSSLLDIFNIWHMNIFVLLLYYPTPWIRVLEKVIVTRTTFSLPFMVTQRRFISTFARVRHQSVSWVKWTQSTFFNPVSPRTFLILFSRVCLDLPSDLFPSGFPDKFLDKPKFFKGYGIFCNTLRPTLGLWNCTRNLLSGAWCN